MLRSLVTNIIARALLMDDPVQSPLARQLLAVPAMVLPSVFMEAHLVALHAAPAVAAGGDRGSVRPA